MLKLKSKKLRRIGANHFEGTRYLLRGMGFFDEWEFDERRQSVMLKNRRVVGTREFLRRMGFYDEWELELQRFHCTVNTHNVQLFLLFQIQFIH